MWKKNWDLNIVSRYWVEWREMNGYLIMKIGFIWKSILQGIRNRRMWSLGIKRKKNKNLIKQILYKQITRRKAKYSWTQFPKIPLLLWCIHFIEMKMLLKAKHLTFLISVQQYRMLVTKTIKWLQQHMKSINLTKTAEFLSKIPICNHSKSSCAWAFFFRVRCIIKIQGCLSLLKGLPYWLRECPRKRMSFLVGVGIIWIITSSNSSVMWAPHIPKWFNSLEMEVRKRNVVPSRAIINNR